MSDNHIASNRKIDEALQLLNEAAKEKKDELKRLLGERYGSIREALTEVAMNNRDVVDRVKRLAADTLEDGQERVREAATEIDREVRNNPWPYIGGAAAAALLVGYLMGSSRR
jgi:ElaB/YqjD/DUF883 family membrane-anchored ribosome-binding protein